ncbi:MAG: DUF2478 domain-containing protein [Planctomycetes bacterium]|nr:DUF2478 domain-containing protein [Planctomycetota bacterium]
MSGFESKTGLILFAGDRHAGKTTAVAGLAQILQEQGFKVGGFISLSCYQDLVLTGYDLFELGSQKRMRLAREYRGKNVDQRRFEFNDGAFEYVHKQLLNKEISEADMVIIDEFGPLEIDGGGFRGAIDELLAHKSFCLLIVVRNRIVEQVKKLYHQFDPVVVEALQDGAVQEVMNILAFKE